MTFRSQRRATALAFGLFTLAGACDAGKDTRVMGEAPLDSVASVAVDPTPVLVDSAIGPAVAGEAGWMYSQSVQADLDGDGEGERVVLTARVELVRGRPAWDDGQPWQVYVEESGGARTYLYSRYVQLGTVTLRIGAEDGVQRPSVILIEHLPDRLAVYELEYSGPGQVVSEERLRRRLDPTGDAASPMLP